MHDILTISLRILLSIIRARIFVIYDEEYIMSACLCNAGMPCQFAPVSGGLERHCFQKPLNPTSLNPTFSEP